MLPLVNPEEETMSGETMAAVRRSAYGGPEVLRVEQVERPVPGDGEVLIEVAAASVNPVEWHTMTGTPSLVRMQEGLLRPKVAGLGGDVAGRVAALGSGVEGLAVGDEVFGFAREAYAEFAVAKAKYLVPKPARIDFAQAASVPVAALTALQALRDTGAVEAGQRVLINGASGGVGTFAVQIAKQMGAEVSAVCRTRNVEMVRSLGADHVIDYSEQDVTQTGERYDVIFDAVGLRSLRELRRIMAPSGIYVAVSVPKSVPRIILRMIGMAVVSLVSTRKMKPMLSRITTEDLRAVAALIESGDVTPVVERTVPLAEAAAALRAQGEGHARGKTLIVP